jgi:outer membrane protein TolC
LQIADVEIEKQNILKGASFETDPAQIQYQGGQFNTKAYDHNISIQQYFPLGKLTKANKALQDELMILAQKRKSLQAYEIEKAVTLAYYQYLYGEYVLSLNQELDSVYGKFLRNAELRFKTGESGKIEVLRRKSKKERNRNDTKTTNLRVAHV